MKKGDRVEFKDSEGLKYGVVTKKRGDTLTVMQDGGEIQSKGPFTCFKLSDHPLPKDEPSVMDKWDAKISKTFIGREGHGFNGKITLNGKKVADVTDPAVGGTYQYYFKSKELQDQFNEEVKDWHEQFTEVSRWDMQDLWVFWTLNHRPYGVTAKEYLNQTY